jgi:Virus neck protein
MAVSQYFNNYNAKNEQNLVEDLIVESIKIQGFDAFYLPNNNDAARDLLYGEDPTKRFESAFAIEMYLSSALEYSGEREFFSKFGLEIKNNVTVIMSKRSFSQRVPQDTLLRPREGDLVYVPFLYGTGELYEITFVDATKDFFTLGRKMPYFYELHLEKFKYSNEVIGTGVAEIDIISTQDSYTIDLIMSDHHADYLPKELVYQSPDGTYANATTVAVASSWYATNNTLYVTNIAGEFTPNANVIGVTSGTSISLNGYDDLNVTLDREVYDNKIIQTEANQVTDFSEMNPFGEINGL